MSDGLAIDATVRKRYGTRWVLDGATLQVQAGEIHAVLGENGAGKSTLLGCIYGTVPIDQGELVLAGTRIDPRRHDARAARRAGLAMVHQHGIYVPSMTVAENVALAYARPLAEVRGQLVAAAERTGFAVAPDTEVGRLNVADRQRAELVGAIASGATTLILDEPTALLTPAEVDALWTVLRRLQQGGATLVVVTHKLAEVRALAQRLTVLRAGRTIVTLPGDAPIDEVARAVVGAAPAAFARPPAVPVDAPVRLRVRGLVCAGLGPIDLDVRAGEILGVAGVEGNGQLELGRALAGVIAARGEVVLDGVALPAGDVQARTTRGVAVVPGDRHADGLASHATLRDNLVVGRPDRDCHWRRNRAQEQAWAEADLASFDVRPPEPDRLAGTLSGGNQQKLVLARELGRPNLALVIASHPTRGVDLGAAHAIQLRLRQVADLGAAVLLISADLDELFALSTRLTVLYRGVLQGELAGTARDHVDARATLGAWMLGNSQAARGPEVTS